METKTKTGIGIILALIATFIVVGVTDKEPTHYCLSKEIKEYCFEIRDFSDKENYRCLYDETNKRRYYSCQEGWQDIPFIETITRTGSLEHCNSGGCVSI